MKKILLSAIIALFGASTMAQTSILQESFETNALPVGWQQETYNTPAVDWLFGAGGYPFQSGAIDYSKTPPVAHSGTYNACFYNATGTASQTKLILPAIDMSDKRVYKIRFWHTQGCFYNQSLAVYFKEGASGAWKRLKNYTEILYSWQDEELTIPSSNSQVYIAFEGIWDGGCGICLDDIEVRAFDSYNILFRMKDVSNNPISGATVTFADTIKLTNASGEALYQRIPQTANMSVVIRKLGFRPKRTTINVSKTDTITYNLPYSRIIYVKQTAAGLNNGKNWTDAYSNLQQALDSAYEGDQIWIAKGVYKPTTRRSASISRSVSFSLKNEVAVFGGFSGVAGTEGSTASRNITAYPSVLSGDIDNNDVLDASGVSTSIIGNNAYFVLYNNNSGVDNSSILHGVYLSGAKSSNQGVAIYNYKVSPTFNNCYIVGNESQVDAVVLNKESSAQYLNCTFSNNKNGAMLNIGSDMQLQNCSFVSNTVYGVKNQQSSVFITGCTFDKTVGIGLINDDASPTVDHSVFTANTIGMQNISNANPTIFASSFSTNDSLAVLLDNASATIDSCTLTGNKKGAISAIDQSISNVFLVKNSTFEKNGNGNNEGGAIYCEGYLDSKITNCSFAKDTALRGGAMMLRDNHAVQLTNCRFWRNGVAENGGALAIDNASPAIRFCTFASNYAANNGGALYSNGGTPVIVNSILWGDSTSAAANEIDGTYNASYSTIRGITSTANHNSDKDPRFVDVLFGVLRLKGNSPAINAATTITGVVTDLRGRVRPLGTAPDMGCYERDRGIEIIWAKPQDNEAIVGPITKIIMVFDDNLVKNAAGTINLYNYKTDVLVHSQDIAAVSINADTLSYTLPTALDYDNFYFVITPDALAGSNSGYTYIGTEPRDDYNFSVHRPILYVKYDAAGSKTGFDWTNAYTNLQAALDTSVYGQQIWVARGTYKPSYNWDKASTRALSFYSHKGVKILGGFPGASGQEGQLSVRNPSLQRTTLSGDLDANDPATPQGYTTAPIGNNALHIIYCTARNSDTANVFDGFTITGGIANDTKYNSGAAVFVNKSAIKLISCTIAGNTATNGGALFASDSKILVAQCLLAYNTAVSGSIADANNTSLRFYNNTSVKNTASSGTLFNNNDGVIMINSIVWGNTPATNIFAQNCTVNYSLVQDAAQGDGTTVAGVANKDSIPRFVDFDNNDFRLRSCSPAVDAGVNDTIKNFLSLDIINKTRIVDGNADGIARVDMGAYEFDGNCLTYVCNAKYDNCWLGCYNNNWHDANNWTAGIPTSSQAVYIAGIDKTCYQPQVKANQTANVKTVDIDVDNQAIITIDATNNAVLRVND